MVSAYIGGTRGSGVLSSAGDVLEMSVVRSGVYDMWDMCLCFCCGGVGGVVGKWVGGLCQGLGGWCSVMSVCVVSLDYLCRWQIQVSVYCARRIPAHLRVTQCSILLHHIDICFLTCICLWHISLIQTWLRVVVGPGLVLTSPAFMRSISSLQQVRMTGLAKNGNRATIAGGRRGRHNLHRGCHTTVRAPLRVGCVFWCHQLSSTIPLSTFQIQIVEYSKHKQEVAYITSYDP